MGSPSKHNHSKPKRRSSSNTMAMSSLVFNRCMQVVNYLVSFQESAPFILMDSPPITKVKRPMDFTTLERHLYSQHHYTSFHQFQRDLALIWENALAIYQDVNHPIYKKATALQQYYQDMDNDPRFISSSISKDLPSKSTINIGENSTFYITLLALESSRQKLCNQLNGPLIRFLKHLSSTPYPRLYINHHRSVLREAVTATSGDDGGSGSGHFAMLWNTIVRPHSGKQGYILVSTNITLASPVGDVHDMQQQQQQQQPGSGSGAPKAWVKLKPFTTHRHVQLILPASMEDLYFRRAYTTYRILPTDPCADRWTQCLVKEQTKASAQHQRDDDDYDDGDDDDDDDADDDIEDADEDPLDINDDDDNDDDDDDDDDDKQSNTSDDPQHMATHYGPPPVSMITSAVEATAAANHIDLNEDTHAMATYSERTAHLFARLKSFAISKGVLIASVQKYMDQTTSYANAEGYFKQVRYVKNNTDVVVQTFQRMTTSQRATELVGLLKLKGLAHMADIKEVLVNGEDGGDGQDISGLSMQRYQLTLKQYTHAHTHHRLTAHQKMDLIRQMLVCLQVIHDHGIAHRDLSEVNFMVDKAPHSILEDGSSGAHVYLIDFGKAVFTQADDVRRWWIEPVPRAEKTTTTMTEPQEDYEGEVIPKTRDELEAWCAHLPLIYVKPDHGYRCYRSIQTLPRGRTDREVLPWLVDPIAEDMYSIGALIWKIFAETEPWHGILDSDLKGLRERVEDDDQIETQIGKEIAGDLSRQLVLLCLRVNPQDRISARDLLAWIDTPEHHKGLLDEWTLHAPTQRKRRHKKSMFRFEEEQARHQQQIDTNRLAKRKKVKVDERQRKAEAKAAAAKVERQRQKEEARVRQQQQLWEQHRQMQMQLQQQQPYPPSFPPPPYFLPPYHYNQGPPPPPPSQNGMQGYGNYPYPPFVQSGSSGNMFPYPPPPPPPTTYIPPTSGVITAPRAIRFRPPLITNPTPIRPHDPTLGNESAPTDMAMAPPPPPPPNPYITTTPPHMRHIQQKLPWAPLPTPPFPSPTSPSSLSSTTTTTTTNTPQPPPMPMKKTMGRPPKNNSKKQQPPRAAAAPSKSRKPYVPTGRPVGRPRGTFKKRKSSQSSASEFEP